MSAPVREPRCGMCRYPVRGLPTFSCPECGNDLRKVGIIATGIRSRATRRQRVGYWTLLFIITAIPLAALADNLLRWRNGNTTITMRSLNGNRDVSLTVVETGYAWPLTRRNVQLQFESPGPQSILVDVNQSLSYRVAGGAASGGARLSENAMEAWFGTPPAQSPSVKQEALDLLAMIKAALADGDLRRRPPVYFQQRAFRYTGSGGRADYRVILGGLALLWIVGAWIVVRRTEATRSSG